MDHLKRFMPGEPEKEEVLSVNTKQSMNLPKTAEAIENTLMHIWKRLHGDRNIDKNTVEIEIRVGMIVLDNRRWQYQSTDDVTLVLPEDPSRPTQFVPGIDESLARTIALSLLVPPHFTPHFKARQVLRLDGSRTRYEVDSRGSVLGAEHKARVFLVDHALLSYAYDIRFGIAQEKAVAVTVGVLGQAQQPPLHFTSERVKKRVTFTPTDPALADWVVDLTEILSYDLNSRGERAVSSNNASPYSRLKDTELEIEMDKSRMVSWLNISDEAEALNHARRLREGLLQLLDLLLPCNREVVLHQNITLMQPIPELIRQQIITISDSFAPGTSVSSSGSGGGARGRKLEFVGSKPLNLNRRTLHAVQRTPYFLTEKSDGLRSLLYVVNLKRSEDEATPEAVLVSRSKEVRVYRIPGGKIIGAVYGTGTVLDGELVYNRSFRRTVFLVFDLLASAGESLTRLTFRERLQRLTSLVRDRAEALQRTYSQQRKQYPAESVPLPLEIVRKTYYTDLSELLSKITQQQGEYVYKDTDRRHHQTDGLIFQPDLPYTCGNDPSLLKWKYRELRTVDLRVQLSGEATGGRVQLFCDTDGGPLDVTRRSSCDFTIFGRFDQYRLLADMLSQSSGASASIAEVMYDTAVGCWRYLRLRRDKDEPNFVDTVVGVLMEQGEDIGLEELELTLLAATADNWGGHLFSAPTHSASELFERELSNCKTELIAKVKRGLVGVVGVNVKRRMME